MSPNDADGMANSVDPDQTAPLIWVCTVCPGISVRKLRIITVCVMLFEIFQMCMCSHPLGQNLRYYGMHIGILTLKQCGIATKSILVKYCKDPENLDT